MWRAVVSRPFDRSCQLPALGDIDHKAGEFWVGNAFLMPRLGANLSAYERNRLFLNVGPDGFLDASFASRADIDADSRSVVAADFNGDNTPDLLVSSVGGGPLRLFLNRFPRTAHRLRLNLEGTVSNRKAIGTRVIAFCGKRQIIRDLFPPNGCMGQGPPQMILGVGQATTIDRLTVRWPTGRLQEFHNLPVDCRLTIREGEQKVLIEHSAASPAP